MDENIFHNFEYIRLGFNIWVRKRYSQHWERDYKIAYEVALQSYQKIKDIDDVNIKDENGRSLLHYFLDLYFSTSHRTEFVNAGFFIERDIINLINNPSFDIKYKLEGLDYVSYVKPEYVKCVDEARKIFSSLSKKVGRRFNRNFM